jgi:hypothetical protein
LLFVALHGEESAVHKICNAGAVPVYRQQHRALCTDIHTLSTSFVLACVPFATAAAEISAAATPASSTAEAAARAAEEAKGWFTGAAAHKQAKRVIVIVGTAGKACERQNQQQTERLLPQCTDSAASMRYSKVP